MKLQLRLCAFVVSSLAGLPTQSYAGVTPSIYGVWSNPVLAGFFVDGSTGVPTFRNNNGTAIDSITGPTSNTLTWGSWLNLEGVPSCGDIAPTPCASSITFTGATLPPDPTKPFTVGTISFTNGTSTITTFIFGATLTFYTTASPTPIGSDFVDIVGTANDGTAEQNADYITFSGLSGKSFNVYEGATAVVGLTGYIDDLVLTDITAQDSFGFVGNSPTLPTGVPEPATLAMFSAGLAGAVAMRRRKKKAA